MPKAMVDEQLLEGGNGNLVVRVGNTVRRHVSPATVTVQRLLAHVRERGLTWVPEPLGFDEQGREVVSFLGGEVVQESPDWLWRDSLLERIARAMRQLHDATVDFDTAGATWSLPAVDPPQVICHNDFAPYNCVFQNQNFTGLIDFDTCAPGPRLWDLGYTAYRFIPLLPPRAWQSAKGQLPWNNGRFEFSPFDTKQLYSRLETFASAYAQQVEGLLYEPESLIASAIERLEALNAWTENQAQVRNCTELRGHAQMYRAHASWLHQL